MNFIHYSPSIIHFVKRWWQRMGFGIESRTDYAFLHDVIREKRPYYIYEDIEKLFPNATSQEQHRAKLLFRLGNHLRPTEIRYFGNVTDINRYALSHTITKGSESSTMIFIEGEAPREVSAALPLASLIAVTDIHDSNASLWQTLLEQPHSITFDSSLLGIAIIDRKRFAAHYNI